MMIDDFYNNQTQVEWPASYDAAAMLSIDIDTVTPMLWREKQDLNKLSISEIEQRRFGISQGVSRLLDIFIRLNIKATFFIPSYVADSNPKMVIEILELGHEIGLHGYLHEEVGLLSMAENLDILDKSIDILEKLTGKLPVGYRSPSWDMVSYLPQALLERGICYDSSLMGFEQPYVVNNLLELPVSWVLDDAPHFMYLGNGKDPYPPQSAQSIVGMWTDSLDSCLKYHSLFSLTVHPWIIGRMDRIGVFERFLTSCVQNKRLWFATGAEIAQQVKNQNLPQVTLSMLSNP